MKEETKETQPSDLAEAITAELAVAYRKILEFKQYKGTPVVVSENDKLNNHRLKDGGLVLSTKSRDTGHPTRIVTAPF